MTQCIRCSREAQSDKVLCTTCIVNAKKNGKRRIARLKVEGTCTRCSRNPADSGMYSCLECRSERKTEYKKYHQLRKQQGLCARCGRTLDNKEFIYCLNCKAKEKLRHLSRHYNISKESIIELLERQEWRCAICLMELDLADRQMVLDHNHTTNKVRGFLCVGCNVGIGHIEKNGGHWVTKALQYLKETDGG